MVAFLMTISSGEKNPKNLVIFVSVGTYVGTVPCKFL